MQNNDNALLNFSQYPRFSEIKPEQAESAVAEVLAALAAAADAAAAAAPHWDSIMTPLAAAEEAVARVWNQIEHMHAVMSTPPWRDAHRNNLEKVAAQFVRLGQHQKLYANLLELAKTAADLPPVRQKILADALLDFQLSGVGLPPQQRQEFGRHSEKLSALAARFEENLLDATNDGGLTTPDESGLGDMPDDLKAAARRPDGFYFGLQQPSFAAFMQYSPRRDLRQQLYRGYNTRASEYGAAARDNSPLIEQILSLRARQAQLLGFASYADMAMQTRMAETPAAVDFLRDLAARARPAAKQELAEMRDFAAEHDIKDLQPWDLMFVSEQLRQRRFDFSTAELRPYLQVERVLRGLFSCITQLFGVRLEEAAAPRWLEETRYFHVCDTGGRQIGGLYLDLFARKTKRGGAWMGEALSRCRRNGALQLPTAHVVCNFTPPQNNAAALLNWEEALTLFHEFGHALHHVLTEVEEYSAAGTNGVEWDAVEFPSQFMENFIWDWRVLEPMTAHAQSGAPMPRALFDKALAARRFQSGMHLLRQVEFALFDLSLHAAAPRPVMEVLRETRKETALLEVPEWNRFPCGFSHIFAGGYAAGYYSYLWAETLAADVFAMFEESGDIINPRLGARFRREVLAAGGGRPAMESFVAVRGRNPDPAALLKHYGLA